MDIEVRRLVRHLAQAPGEIGWDPAAGTLDVDDLADVDVVVHLGGRTIGGRFTPSNKREMRASSDRQHRPCSRVLSPTRRTRPSHLVRVRLGHRLLRGRSGRRAPRRGEPQRRGLPRRALLGLGASHRSGRRSRARVANVRTGIVQSPAGGALARQFPLFRAGLGGRLGDGEQWVSWISIDDVVGVFAHAALTDDVVGPINAVAPEPVRGGPYAEVLGSVLHRPAVLPVPAFGPALLLGREGAAELALASQRVAADALVATGYEFRQPSLDVALRHVLGR